MPQIEGYGTSVVAISPQIAVNSRKSVRDNKLRFPVRNDANGEIGFAFGLRFALPNYLIDLYKALKNDLPAFNADPSWTLPMPARYVVGQDGVRHDRAACSFLSLGQPGRLSLALYRGWHLPPADTLDT
ncbi:peroxiredoxin [Paraburkholderia sp. JPY162]|uniref:Peroxiredoxin n=1 Tax=Paraburkholderia youngii TaxID=2782701 RepID=A0A7W8LD35_9BURK|nr:peroxiredoxin [Paraburkholderia youngii]